MELIELLNVCSCALCTSHTGASEISNQLNQRGAGHPEREIRNLQLTLKGLIHQT